ncbi:FtsW/RodA/SpoVE family cell cycle protein [bacterium]|nr:FtsW/RodA/SpoVE family cell cycle protein [bacterium]
MNYSLPYGNRRFSGTRTTLDLPLLASVLALCVVGIVFVFTSSAVHSRLQFHGHSDIIVSRHVARLAIGLAAMSILALVKFQLLHKIARALMVISLVGLIAVLLLPKLPDATAKRWLMIFGFSFQPAELAKYALIAYMARRFTEIEDCPFPAERTRKTLGVLGLVALVLVLVVTEPNLSMALLIAATATALFFLHGVPIKWILMALPIAGAGAGVVVLIKPYMLERIRYFLAAITDPLAASFHVKQSLIAVGQGGWLGLGLGQSTQKHFYLPEPYNDSIFSIIGEEIGFVGSMLVILLFVILISRSWRIAVRAQRGFSYYLAAGITVSLACSFIVNVGVNLAVLPATGQPLPFVSFGGTSLIMSLSAVGVLLNIARQQAKNERWFPNGPPQP